MRITVVGVGHVGLVTAAAMARWGHDVVGMDHVVDKIALLLDDRIPFFEPGLDDLVREGVASGRLRFTDDLPAAIDHAEVVFVCVGTPALPGGGPNLTYVEAVGRQVVEHAREDMVLVEKSTVPANTGHRLERLVAREQARLGRTVAIDVASNPEFLREGCAVEDTLRPDRIVYGTSSQRARTALRALYAVPVAEQDVPVVETDVSTAELIKHASNAFLATRISFINAVAAVCEEVGADVEQVAHGMGLDERIGPHFLKAGLGYGGSCFPKDVDAFIHLASEVGQPFGLLEEVRAINRAQRDRVLSKLRSELWHLEAKTIALLGVAFKPGTDDLREAPAVHLARAMIDEGADVRLYDPVALEAVAEQLPEATLCPSPLEACKGAHGVVVCTEWPEVRALTPDDLLGALAYPIVVDGRNVFDPETMIAAGVRYHSIGRPGVTP